MEFRIDRMGDILQVIQTYIENRVPLFAKETPCFSLNRVRILTSGCG